MHTGYSIAARFDLEKSSPSPDGGYDTKVRARVLAS
jgi:hypothetical protein